MEQKIIDPESMGDDDAGDAGLAQAGQRVFQAQAAQHGQRLDRALAEWVPEVSRSYLAQLVQDGHVRVDDGVVRKPALKLAAGSVVALELVPTPSAAAFRPEPLDFPVVFEDAHVLVVNKPVGLVVHPGAGNWSGTLLNGLLQRSAQAADLPRAGIVHRLDKNTSGLMVVAKSRSAMHGLVTQLAARQVRRIYLAVAAGAASAGQRFHVDQPIGRDARNRLRMAVCSGGKPAQTEVEVLDAAADVALLRCSLLTGRTHQIRVHLAWLGRPLLGDGLYGGAQRWGMSHQALHAHDLAFDHPVSGRPMHWWVPPPAPLRQAIAAAGLGYNPQPLLALASALDLPTPP